MCIRVESYNMKYTRFSQFLACRYLLPAEKSTSNARKSVDVPNREVWKLTTREGGRHGFYAVLVERLLRESKRGGKDEKRILEGRKKIKRRERGGGVKKPGFEQSHYFLICFPRKY